MSFVPAPQQANAAVNVVAPTAQVAAATTAPESEYELQFKNRTFDVYWVEKNALMYRDGFAKVRLVVCSFVLSVVSVV
jgi:ATP-dependent RNA helicase DDX60